MTRVAYTHDTLATVQRAAALLERHPSWYDYMDWCLCACGFLHWATYGHLAPYEQHVTNPKDKLARVFVEVAQAVDESGEGQGSFRTINRLVAHIGGEIAKGGEPLPEALHEAAVIVLRRAERRIARELGVDLLAAPELEVVAG